MSGNGEKSGATYAIIHLMQLDPDICYRAISTRDARFDGQFFTGVRTTGIYCRPVCPARTPKRENVTFFPSAAAAQGAGFRPCLRCRPETTPDLAAWRGTASTVSRAMALIGAGALNRDSVEALATRLGMGERQLRRLFRQHLGASPKSVAQARRVHFAKQLVTDTTLPMAEIALAAGFGSLRRFNDTFQRLYGRPPRSLRRAGTATVPPSAITLTLPFKPPYDWDSLIGFLAARAIPGVEAVEPGRYARSIALGGRQGSIEIRPASGANALVATIRFPDIAALPEIVERIRRIFDLGADPAAIGTHLAEDSVFAPLVARRPGLRVPGAWDGFELAVRGILGQQITVGAAQKLATKLVAHCGTPVDSCDESSTSEITHVFPSPPQVAAIENLAIVLGMPRQRAASLIALARAAAQNPALFDTASSLDASVARLRALPGIGDWTAQYIAMRALREPDAFPAADIGLLRATATADGRMTPAQLLTRAAAWRPWRAYAAIHLWTHDASGEQPAPPVVKETTHEPRSRSRSLAAGHDSAGL